MTYNATPDWLAQRARLSPDRPAVIFEARQITFKELDRDVTNLTAALRRAGIAPGDLVALLMRNTPAMVSALHSLARAGAISVPLNTRLTKAEIQWQIADCRPSLLLHDAELAPEAAELARHRPGLKALDLAVLPTQESGPEWPDPFGLERVHTIVYTSGTTGRPKGAMLTFGNHFYSAIGSALNLGLHAGDCWLACLPLFHVGGLAILLRSVIYGIPVVLQKSFDPVAANQGIDGHGATIVSVVANMLQRMLEVRGDRPFPPTLRCVLLGGGPAPGPLLEECARKGVPVVQTYGLTEAASQVATLAPEDAIRRLGSAGRPLFLTEVLIERDDGTRAGPGEAGEICVRGPTVTPGYLHRDEETEVAFCNGWLHTGDFGYVDDEGYFYVTDRREDLIVSGGENVYPAEVEAALLAHEAVAEAGVVGFADARWGQAVAATIVLRKGAEASAEDIISFCRQRLAGYKVPRRLSFTSELPRNAAGKLLRERLRQEWAAEPEQ